ncbi:MAG TPA: MauE/DoxX family redox-associated membrane protein [Candidatus Lustribacter sp.]
MIERVVLVLRVALGLVFLAAGGLKVGHADVFASEIAGFQLLPHALIAPLALLLPFLELMIGVYLILGLFTRFAAWLAALEMAVFAVAIASAVMRGISTSCGCFGPSDHATTSWPEVGRDLGFALMGVVIAWWAPGALALDRRMENSK